MQSFHGISLREGRDPPTPLTADGRYRHMFPFWFARPRAGDRDLEILAGDTRPLKREDTHPAWMPAGYTYFAQFVAHDLSFDTTALSEAVEDVRAVRNFRTPRLELDSLYGLGPRAQPFLYRDDDPAKLRLHPTTEWDPFESLPDGDLARLPGGQAVIADPRNDDNLIVAQLHVAFAQFHNGVVEHLDEKGRSSDRLERCEEARRTVVWHYQWLVLNDLLPRIIPETVWRAFSEGNATPLPFPHGAYIPYEFARAAFRLHTLVRNRYGINPWQPPTGIKRLLDLTGRGQGSCELPLPSAWIVDWREFFPFDDGYQPAHALDRVVTAAMHAVDDPLVPGGQRVSVPLATLRRGHEARLPSGQAIGEALGVATLSAATLGMGADGRPLDVPAHLLEHTPLWYYLMREAESPQGGGGAHLGPVGGYIVASVLYGLVDADPLSYLHQAPHWQPEPIRRPDPKYPAPPISGDGFTMADLLSRLPNPWIKWSLISRSDQRSSATELSSLSCGGAAHHPSVIGAS